MGDTGGNKTGHVELISHETVEDDWAGISDPRERRKIQNRLAQRAYRVRNSRKGSLRIKFFRPSKDICTVEAPTKENALPSCSVVCLLPRKGDHNQIMITEIDEAEVVSAQGNTPALNGVLSSELMIRNEELELIQQWKRPIIARIYVGGVPKDHEFINLVYYNVYRALEANLCSLGLSSSVVCLDILSPFNVVSLGGTVSENLDDDVLIAPSSDLILSLPPTLQPTALQISIIHHPWIDIFPCPRLRDNLLCAGDLLDNDEICQDICVGDSGDSGLIVWGEPWDPLGWEITEPFAQRWPWVLEGCDDVIQATNYWRALRGLEKLDLGV